MVSRYQARSPAEILKALNWTWVSWQQNWRGKHTGKLSLVSHVEAQETLTVRVGNRPGEVKGPSGES